MEVVDRFEVSRWDGARGLARCPEPGHKDQHPSLSIARTADGRWLIHCFAGCRTDAVLAAVGLRFADLWPGAPRRFHPRAGQRTEIGELVAGFCRQQMRLRPYLSVFELADRVRAGEQTAAMLRARASAAGDTEMGWDLAAAAAGIEDETRLDEVSYVAALEAAGRRPKR